ncbi:hypothetical protein QBC34DRAFT_431779 [Podospora aff. communis PSN243]|uniref:Zn(2)-C6 fungal-type domain-containing protein n=1 Tax=Podospora aff. communis PSN243 TaxID=3040156 RepID=A0AAV9G0L4_9PEZI|nr:hypothetical protein QBC34DRAFT_431779 [Podospora aff. communis PSN243]
MADRQPPYDPNNPDSWPPHWYRFPPAQNAPPPTGPLRPPPFAIQQGYDSSRVWPAPVYPTIESSSSSSESPAPAPDPAPPADSSTTYLPGDEQRPHVIESDSENSSTRATLASSEDRSRHDSPPVAATGAVAAETRGVKRPAADELDLPRRRNCDHCGEFPCYAYRRDADTCARCYEDGIRCNPGPAVGGDWSVKIPPKNSGGGGGGGGSGGAGGTSGGAGGAGGSGLYSGGGGGGGGASGSGSTSYLGSSTTYGGGGGGSTSGTSYPSTSLYGSSSTPYGSSSTSTYGAGSSSTPYTGSSTSYTGGYGGTSGFGSSGGYGGSTGSYSGGYGGASGSSSGFGSSGGYGGSSGAGGSGDSSSEDQWERLRRNMWNEKP